MAAKAFSDQKHLVAFSRRLKRMLDEKHWTGAELAREASKFVPENFRKGGKRYKLGRHVISAYCRGENEPTSANLGFIAQALGVQPSDLLPPKHPAQPIAPLVNAITSLDGKTRLVVDVELETEVALRVVELIRISLIDGNT